MGDFIVYTIKSSLLLTFLFAAYKLTAQRLLHFGIRRLMLVAIYLCAILIPLADFTTHFNTQAPSPPPVTPHMFDKISPTALAVAPQDDSNGECAPLLNYIAFAMMAGIVVNALLTAIGFLRIIKYRLNSRIVKYKGMRLAVTDTPHINPFTFGNTIYLSQKDYEESNPMILLHEHCHCTKCHYLDLILARIVCCLMWWNPFTWLMLRELHDVHEFQADNHVIAYGFDLKCYQYLLIKKAAGSRLQTFADSLNHSKLKKRLTMMKKSKKKERMLSAFLMVPALFAGSMLMSTETLAAMLEPLRNVDLHSLSLSDVPERAIAQNNSKISENFTMPQLSDADKEDNQSAAKAISENDMTINPNAVGKPETENPHVASVATLPPDDIDPHKENERDGNEQARIDSKPAIKIDGELMPDSFDMTSINPEDIESITVFKDNKEEFPNGLLVITTKKYSKTEKSESGSKEPVRVVASGTVKKQDNSANSVHGVPNVYIVNKLDNINGTNVEVTIVPGNGKEVTVKDAMLKVGEKTYKAESVSSSFSKSDGASIQKVKVHIKKTLHHFDNDDTVVLQTSSGTIQLPLHDL